MPKLLKRLCIAVAFLAGSTGIALADFELNILHFNDFHSRIEPINKYDSTCSEKDRSEGKCFGGIARLKTAIDQRRKASDNVLVLSAGDNFQGSVFYTVYKGKAEAEFLDLIGLDANVLGNHEFDDGDEALASFLDNTNFPTIYGNALIGANSPLAGKMVEYVMKDFGNEKVAVIGAVTADTVELSSPSEAVLFMDPVLYLNDAVETVKAEGATVIIALTHVGVEEDKKIAAEVDGLDLIVGGHSNTLMSNTADNAHGPYPTMLTGPSGKQVALVHAYAHSKYLGDVTLVFADDGTLKSASGEPVLLDASVTPDPEMVKRIEEMAAPIQEKMDEVIAMASAAIDGNRESCRARECEMGNLVTDAMLDRVSAQGISIAIQNGGGLRASIDEGDITVGEVFTVLPFQNTLSTFKLIGSDVVAALENGVSQVEEGAGRFPQVSGLKYSFDLSLPPGSRTSNVMVEKNGSYEAIDLNATYGVVSNNFMRAGGDGYKVFAEKATDAYDYGPGLEDVVQAYLASNSPYKPYVGTRITEVTPKDTMAKGSEKTASASQMAKEDATAMKTAVDDAGRHIVKEGDNLWTLAEKYLGDPFKWGDIAKANPDQNPHRLEVGQQLNIPAKAN
ncbi:5'-nucleotidase C-terminal domain-containing protein [Hoeflea prorocentri]|uniref:5'-nucleotidase C-terminal domain-containing protein n=1 Tax=Hoeflea prorocentri TaxID=1922333 RepID=A0A9X3ZF36_9HYPH|nr:5'-nucleotidase C-terminal domain-containing protein [Hoeflea prorocentri]MCY6379256.1 5'-nucleotidase C-terminal domain-containing protein [Hoeflea prorocentri]MDA5397057.1 5'-nucleotidase C-terminal domain-containing protein [Hoeflea prorocentri]